jgi:hypothetical protein
MPRRPARPSLLVQPRASRAALDPASLHTLAPTLPAHRPPTTDPTPILAIPATRHTPFESATFLPREISSVSAAQGATFAPAVSISPSATIERAHDARGRVVDEIWARSVYARTNVSLLSVKQNLTLDNDFRE